MRINILTIFPEIIQEYSSHSIIKKSLDKELWELNIVNIRNYSLDRFNRVDDKPYGLEQGMLIKPDVLGNCIDNVCKSSKIVYMSPKGKLLNQEKIRELLNYNNISIICGRYEGIDERVIEEYDIEEISVGDFVVMGGELPALMLVEGVVRCLDNVIGDKRSQEEDSFGGATENKYNYLLEYPLYTKPETWRNRKVPDILLSGNHKKIEEWKLEQSIEITKNRRPDLYNKYTKTLKPHIHVFKNTL